MKLLWRYTEPTSSLTSRNANKEPDKQRASGRSRGGKARRRTKLKQHTVADRRRLAYRRPSWRAASRKPEQVYSVRPCDVVGDDVSPTSRSSQWNTSISEQITHTSGASIFISKSKSCTFIKSWIYFARRSKRKLFWRTFSFSYQSTSRTDNKKKTVK